MTAGVYPRLESAFRRAALIGEAAGLLHWDQAVNMPAGSAEARAEQMAELHLLSHEVMTDPRLADWFAEAADEPLDGWQAANLREMRRQWVHATALDGDLVQAMTRAESACEMVWRDARPKADYAAVLPYLEEVLRLTRRAAEAKADRLGCGLYDALLDQYEPDARAAAIDPVFDDLAGFLPGTIDAALARQAQDPPLPLDGPFPIDKQREVGIRVMQTIGFDFTRGRLDVSLHPFCGGASDDIRITTRYEESEFVSSLMGVIHETGHALYEAQLPRDWRHQPVGGARGMMLHESQSLLMEMQACRSPEFLAFLAPILRETYGGSGPAWEADNLAKIYTTVERGFIRVDADEITYPAHVILRYRLEQALVAGELALRDLPGAWNEGMRDLLGIVPPDDRLGCLQDIHWYSGAFGYFPTYTLGALAAAQIFAAACAAVPGLLEAIGRGDFAPLLGWLAENVHGQGSRLTAPELIETATGQPLSTDAFKAHVRARYLD